MLGHELEFVGKVPIITIGPHRNSRGDLSIELRWVETPLFTRIVSEKLFVQIAPYPAEDNLL